jgi:hypothetical protein
MGNNKPVLLTRVESQLWSTFLNIASGVPALEGLKTFSEQFKKIEAEDSKNLNLDWFAQGKSSIFSYCPYT